MAIVENTFTSYSAIGNRESLQNAIFDVTPLDTPFISGIKKVSGKAKLEEWQTDALAAANVNNKQIEGDDAAFEAITPTARLGNRTQILRKTIVVSNTQDVVDKAGRAEETSYQIARRGKEMRRDAEAILLNNQAAVAGNTTTPATLAGVPAWLTTNTSFGAGAGADPVTIGTTTRTDGTLRSITEPMLSTVLGSIYANSGEQPDTMMVPPGLKATISAFPGNATRYIEAVSEKIVAGVNLYSGQFGEVKIVPNRFMRSRDVLVLNTDFWKLITLRPMKSIELGVSGDAQKRMLVWEISLQSCSEAASGGIFDVQA